MNNDLEKMWGLFDLARGEGNPEEYIYDLAKMICLKSLSEKRYESVKVSRNYWSDIINSKEIVPAIIDSFNGIEQDNPELRNVFTDKPITNKESFWRNVCLTVDDLDISSKHFSKVWLGILDKILRTRRGGMFYTPEFIANLMVELSDVSGEEIFDPFCGIGNIFHAFFEKNNKLHFRGTEINNRTCNFCKLNLLIHNIENFEVFNENYLFANTLNQKIIVSDPPLGLRLSEEELKMANPGIFKYGMPSRNDSTYAFIQKIIQDLSDNGRAIIQSASGVLFREGSEKNIRKGIVNDDLIEGIIQLPANILPQTSIPPVLIIINKNKDVSIKDKVFFLDSSDLVIKRSGKNVISEEGLLKIVETYTKKIAIEGFSHLAKIDEIRKNNYDLSVSRYIQKKHEGLEIRNIAEIETELKKIFDERRELSLDMSKELKEFLK